MSFLASKSFRVLTAYFFLKKYKLLSLYEI